MSLLRLSLVRATPRVPPVPTNAERLKRFRAIATPPTWNTHDWPHAKAQRYAREQSPIDPIPFELRRG